MAGKVKQFLDHVVPGVVKPMRVLWNEMIGFIFICLGLLPIPSAWRAYTEQEVFRMLLTSSFSVIMLYFGLTSFLRAKKINRN